MSVSGAVGSGPGRSRPRVAGGKALLELGPVALAPVRVILCYPGAVDDPRDRVEAGYRTQECLPDPAAPAGAGGVCFAGVDGVNGVCRHASTVPPSGTVQ